MIAITMTPLQRIQWAGLGYLFIYLAAEWRPDGLLGTLVLAACAAAIAVQLLRAAGAGLRHLATPPVHPVQAGKPGRRNRGRLASKATPESVYSESHPVGLGS